MPATMRFRHLFPKDLQSPTIQRNLQRRSRIGQVTKVDPQAGVVSVKWLDRPGFRDDVLITQGADREWCIPEVGAVCVVSFDIRDQARIVRYINLGQEVRSKDFSLPKLKEGEKLWEVGGSFLYMKQNGDIILLTRTEARVTLENSTGTFKAEVPSVRSLTDGGKMLLGPVKRLIPNSDGSKSIQAVKDLAGNGLTEATLDVYEFTPSTMSNITLSTPLISITLGTLVDPDGKIVDKLDRKTFYVTKNVTARIKLKSGVQIDIDKDGRLSIKNAKVNINNGSVDSNDPDIALGLETNNAALGTRGQHVVREHDEVTVPLGTNVVDAAHRGLQSKGSSNIDMLVSLIEGVVSTYKVVGVQSGGSTIALAQLTPFVKPTSDSLKGEVTEGAAGVYLGG